MREIPLTKGTATIVDDCDYEELAKHKWYNCVGYASRRQGTRKAHTDYFMHREIMNPPIGMIVDHINGDRLDNRRENLRVCTHQQNHQNSIKKNTNSTSQYKGVSWYTHANKWRANITVAYKTIYIGVFYSEEEAALAYDRKARELFGEYACTNFQ